MEIVKNKSMEKLPDISQSTDIREIAYVIQNLNLTADVRVGNPTIMSKSQHQKYIDQKLNNKTQNNENKPIKKEDKQVPKIPSISPKRTNEKQVKKNQPMKMNNIEKKEYPPLKQKQTSKVQARIQTKTKTNTMTYKKSTNTDPKGYINIILASITILIVLGIIIII